MDWQGVEWVMPITKLSMLVFGVTLLFIRPRYVVASDKDPGSHDAGL